MNPSQCLLCFSKTERYYLETVMGNFRIGTLVAAVAASSLLSMGFSAEAFAQQYRRFYGPMPGSTPMVIQRPRQPLPGAYIGRSWQPYSNSVPSWAYYNGVGPGYGVGAYMRGGTPSPWSSAWQAGKALLQPSQACAMWVDAQGRLRC